MNLNEKSKYMAYLLRHHPEDAGLTLDSQGYTDVDKLLSALEIDRATLEEIVANDNKKRYSFDETSTRIRANQGHSVEGVNIEFKRFTPTGKIYHGTAKRFEESIMKNGLIPGSRQYVHLSQDLKTAENVGLRHAKSKVNLVIFEIDYQSMIKDGYEFFISENNVVLTKEVPTKYLKKVV